MESQTIYKFIEIKGGKRTEKFTTPDIKRALRFHKWYVNRYKEGLLFEVVEKSNQHTVNAPHLTSPHPNPPHPGREGESCFEADWETKKKFVVPSLSADSLSTCVAPHSGRKNIND